MAKRSKKKSRNSGVSISSALILLVPTALATATAVMNTIVARNNGAFDGLGIDGIASKGSRKTPNDVSEPEEDVLSELPA
jgi:hypothetical protein